MADTKISALASGAPWQSTDAFPIARAGTPKKLTIADLFNAPLFTGTFSNGTANSRGAVEATGAFGGGFTMQDGTGRMGFYSTSSGSEMRIFTGMTSTDTPASKERVFINATGLGVGATPVARVSSKVVNTSDAAFAAVGSASTNHRTYLGYDSTAGYGWIRAANEGVGASPLVLQGAGGSVGIGINPTHLLQIASDDAAKPSTNTWTVASDERLKENIVAADLDRCYAIVKAIPLKRYTWRADVYTPENVPDRSKLGWIAQDVETVFPKAVAVRPFAKVPVEDGTEDVLEQEVLEEDRASIEIVDGRPTLKATKVRIPQFDAVPVVDEAGDPVLVDAPELDEAGEPVRDADGNVKTKPAPLLHDVPRMRTVTRPKLRVDVLEDAKTLNSDQMLAALYGAVQRLQQKVEALEAELAAKA